MSNYIHEETDEFGTLRVSRSVSTVDLLFDEDPNAVQSRLDLHNPKVPSLEYVKAMCLGRSLVPRAKSILILGHGGGTLAKFYTEQLPLACIDIVDVRKSLWGVSQKFFGYCPSATTRFFLCDALKFLEDSHLLGRKYDLILVDLYIDGPANIMSRESLWCHASKLLTPMGFCLANVWRFNQFEGTYECIKHFAEKYFCSVARTDLLCNQCILVMSHLDPSLLDKESILCRTDLDSRNTGIDLSKILRNTKVIR
jgi:spermidine synthase